MTASREVHTSLSYKLAKTLAYFDCGQTDKARTWAYDLATELFLMGLLDDPTAFESNTEADVIEARTDGNIDGRDRTPKEGDLT